MRMAQPTNSSDSRSDRETGFVNTVHQFVDVGEMVNGRMLKWTRSTFGVDEMDFGEQDHPRLMIALVVVTPDLHTGRVHSRLVCRSTQRSPVIRGTRLENTRATMQWRVARNCQDPSRRWKEIAGTTAHRCFLSRTCPPTSLIPIRERGVGGCGIPVFRSSCLTSAQRSQTMNNTLPILEKTGCAHDRGCELSAPVVEIQRDPLDDQPNICRNSSVASSLAAGCSWKHAGQTHS